MKDEEVLAAARASLSQARESLGKVRMERPVAAVVARARARRRRQLVSGGLAASVAAAVAVVLVTGGQPVFGLSPGQAPGGAAGQARTVAYVIKQVENALTSTQMVFRGSSHGVGGPSVTWAYGQRSRWVEFTTKQCGNPLPRGGCTHQGGSQPYLAQGTTFIHGKLTGTYVTYYNHRYSLLKLWDPPTSACSAQSAEEVAGLGAITTDWPAFIHATLGCGAAGVTGHVLIDGVETTRITGKPATIKLSPGYAKVIHERWQRASWTLYVNPATYLPVRLTGSVHMFGGPMASYTSSTVTDVRWLPPTRANIAKASITIPAGFHHWRGSPANQ
jgi:hypothetical protein